MENVFCDVVFATSRTICHALYALGSGRENKPDAASLLEATSSSTN